MLIFFFFIDSQGFQSTTIPSFRSSARHTQISAIKKFYVYLCFAKNIWRAKYNKCCTNRDIYKIY